MLTGPYPSNFALQKCRWRSTCRYGTIESTSIKEKGDGQLAVLICTPAWRCFMSGTDVSFAGTQTKRKRKKKSKYFFSFYLNHHFLSVFHVSCLTNTLRISKKSQLIIALLYSSLYIYIYMYIYLSIIVFFKPRMLINSFGKEFAYR